MNLTMTIDRHPVLDLAAFVTRIEQPTSAIRTPDAVRALATPAARPPLASSDAIRTAVRELLRHGGFKPAGRSKPAPEYLASAFADGRFPSINALVDTCNVVSLHSGLPISLLDVDLLSGELAVRVAPPGTSYVFNPAGQVIDASGLLCLCDAVGPAGSPVKDAQRTKTSGDTRCALSIVWGTRALAGRTAATAQWYRELVAQVDGASIEDVALAG